MAEDSYPEDLKYHAEHDWARIEGDEATFGITWYAQDALGEVVFFDPPEVGTQVTKDQTYAEVESVKAVSDVFAPLSGEIVEVNEALADTPEKINQDPYGDGLDGQGAAVRPLRGGRPAGRGRLQGASLSRYTSITDQDLEAMLDAIGVDSLDDLFADIPESVRLDRELDLPAGSPSRRCTSTWPRSRRATATPTTRSRFLGRRDVRPLRPGADRQPARRAPSS